MEKEKTIRDQMNKLQDELNKIRHEELIKNREKYAGKYFRHYIDDGNNRYQYFYIEKIIDGDLFGWWFTVGDTFTHEFSIASETLPLNYVADDNFYSQFGNIYKETSEISFYQAFQMLLNCVEDRKFVKKVE